MMMTANETIRVMSLTNYQENVGRHSDSQNKKTKRAQLLISNDDDDIPHTEFFHFLDRLLDFSDVCGPFFSIASSRSVSESPCQEIRHLYNVWLLGRRPLPLPRKRITFDELFIGVRSGLALMPWRDEWWSENAPAAAAMCGAIHVLQFCITSI